MKEPFFSGLLTPIVGVRLGETFAAENQETPPHWHSLSTHPERKVMPMIFQNQSKFPLGQTVSTPAALEALDDSGESPTLFLNRHTSGDWGEVCEDDKQANEDALLHGDRILSAYRTAKGVKIWVITEADRSSTCILLPEEY